MEDPLDRHDAGHIEETLRSPGWALIAKRLRETRDRKARVLIDADLDHPATCKMRGEIMGIETALKIPEILAEEAKRTEKPKNAR